MLHNIDLKLFLLINGAHDSFLDFIMYWVSNKLIWIPFYIWLLYVLYRNYNKNILWFLPTVALLIVCSDQFSGLIKNSVMRLRPSHAESLKNIVHLVYGYTGGDYGFISSHAANSMGLTVFLWMMLPRAYKILRLELIAYVILIAYSRIYLAAHYPSDIIGGWILGFILGYIFAKLLQQKIKIPELIPEGRE